METDERGQLARALNGRRQAIAESWRAAIAGTGFVPLDARRVRQQLSEWTGRIIDWLLADGSDPTGGAVETQDLASRLGTGLAELHLIQPGALGRTLQVLAQELTRGLSDPLAAGLQPRLSALLGGMATGFVSRAYETMLAEQETIRAALLAVIEGQEAALRESQARVRAILESTLDGVFLCDRQGRCADVNPAGCRLLGHSRDKILALDLQRLFFPASTGDADQVVQSMWEQGDHRRDLSIQRRDGAELWVEMNVTQFQVGAEPYLLATVRDVTQRRRAEEQVRRGAAQLAALSHMGRTVLASLELESVLRQAVREVQALLNAACVSILLLQDGELVCAAIAGLGPELLVGRPIPAENDAAWQLVHQGSPLERSAACLINCERAQEAAGYRPERMLAAPLKVGDRVLGVIQVVHVAPTAWWADDLSVVEAAASWVALAISHAQEHGAVQRHLGMSAALAQAAEALSRSLDLDTVLDEILTQAMEAIPCRAAEIALIEGESVTIARQRGYPNLPRMAQALASLQLPLSLPGFARMLETGDPVLIADSAECPGWIAYPPGEWIRAYVGAPLEVEGAIFGFLGMHSDQPGYFSSQDTQYLQAFASYAAVAIQNARLYRQLQRALEQEKQARAQLVQGEKLAALGRMVASIAHEVSNPLQIIENCLFIVQQEPSLGDLAQDYVGTAASEIHRLAGLVAQLREVYRPGTGERMGPVDLTGQINELHRLLTPHLGRQRIECRLTLPEQPLVVQGVAHQLRQVFLNLVLNAIETMQPDGGILSVQLTASEASGRAHVSFVDTGPGIRPEDLANLFDPFFSTKEKGVGLGLPLSYDIVSQHGGGIEVQSELGRGTTFIVSLPLATPGGQG